MSAWKVLWLQYPSKGKKPRANGPNQDPRTPMDVGGPVSSDQDGLQSDGEVTTEVSHGQKGRTKMLILG